MNFVDMSHMSQMSHGPHMPTLALPSKPKSPPSATPTAISSKMADAKTHTKSRPVPHQVVGDGGGGRSGAGSRGQHSQMVSSTLAGGAVTRIRTPHAHDVLCGRGGGINSHPGNKAFRAWVQERKEAYNLAASKLDKAKVSTAVMDKVRNLDPPGRFLMREENTGAGVHNNTATNALMAGVTGFWVEIDENKAMAKTSQALREGAPKIRAAHTGDNPPPTATATAPHAAAPGGRGGATQVPGAPANRKKRPRSSSAGPDPVRPPPSGPTKAKSGLQQQQPRQQPPVIAPSRITAALHHNLQQARTGVPGRGTPQSMPDIGEAKKPQVTLPPGAMMSPSSITRNAFGAGGPPSLSQPRTQPEAAQPARQTLQSTMRSTAQPQASPAPMNKVEPSAARHKSKSTTENPKSSITQRLFPSTLQSQPPPKSTPRVTADKERLPSVSFMPDVIFPSGPADGLANPPYLAPANTDGSKNILNGPDLSASLHVTTSRDETPPLIPISLPRHDDPRLSPKRLESTGSVDDSREKVMSNKTNFGGTSKRRSLTREHSLATSDISSGEGGNDFDLPDEVFQDPFANEANIPPPSMLLKSATTHPIAHKKKTQDYVASPSQHGSNLTLSQGQRPQDLRDQPPTGKPTDAATEAPQQLRPSPPQPSPEFQSHPGAPMVMMSMGYAGGSPTGMPVGVGGPMGTLTPSPSASWVNFVNHTLRNAGNGNGNNHHPSPSAPVFSQAQAPYLTFSTGGGINPLGVGLNGGSRFLLPHQQPSSPGNAAGKQPTSTVGNNQMNNPNLRLLYGNMQSAATAANVAQRQVNGNNGEEGAGMSVPPRGSPSVKDVSAGMSSH